MIYFEAVEGGPITTLYYDETEPPPFENIHGVEELPEEYFNHPTQFIFTNGVLVRDETIDDTPPKTQEQLMEEYISRLEDQLTDTQLALTEIYEIMIGE